MDMLVIHFRPIQSVLTRKAEAEPMGSSHRERSQGSAVMCCREVASLPGGMELPLGWSQKRATSVLAKFGLLASFGAGRGAAKAVSGAPMAPVVQAITSGRWTVRFTDEVPRRPAL